MTNFKFETNQVVYNQKNQKRCRIIQRNKVAGTNYYLVGSVESIQFEEKIWIEEKDLDNKSLKEKLFENSIATDKILDNTKITISPIDDAKIVDLPLPIGINTAHFYKTLSGMEVVKELNFINTMLKGLKEDLCKDVCHYTKTLIHKQIKELEKEHDAIVEQMNFVRITYKSRID